MDRKIEKKKWTKGRLLTWGGIAAFILFVLYSFIIVEPGNKLKVTAEKLTIAEVVRGQFRESIPVDGSVLPIKTIRLDAIEGGNVAKKYIEGGILVEKGDTILKLNNNNLLQNFIREETQAFILVNNLQNTKMSLKRNQFELKKKLIELDFQIAEAKDNYERGKLLRDDKVISEQEFLNLQRMYEKLIASRKIEVESQKFDQENSQLQIAQTEATLQRTRHNLEMIKANLDNLYIRAPISGRVSYINVEVGESIASGQNIGQIDDLNGFKVRASIDEHYISRIYDGLKGTFYFDGKTHELVIKKVYPEVNKGLFSVDLEFVSDVPEGIRRGQTLQIKLQLSENIEAVQIPRGSFYQTTGGNYIFVLDESGSYATRRSIRLGRQNPRFYEVIEGLTPGEKVIVSSYEGYEDKDKLILKQ